MMQNLLQRLAEKFRTGPAARRAVAAPDPLAILAIAPLDRDRQALQQIAIKAKWNLTLAKNCEEALDVLGRNRYVPIILCDRDLPGVNWKESLDRLLSKAPGCCAILTSPVNDEYLWSEVIRRGGYDVLTTPFKEEEVNRSINRAWSFWKIGWTRPSSPNAGY